MRFDYSGRAQSEGRVKCERCGLGMLGVNEIDLSLRHPGWEISFCKCPDTPKPDTERPSGRKLLESIAAGEAYTVISRGERRMISEFISSYDSLVKNRDEWFECAEAWAKQYDTLKSKMKRGT